MNLITSYYRKLNFEEKTASTNKTKNCESNHTRITLITTLIIISLELVGTEIILLYVHPGPILQLYKVLSISVYLLGRFVLKTQMNRQTDEQTDGHGDSYIPSKKK